MTKSRKNISTNRWVFPIMIFAFMWLVMGELITLHQKAIYDFDPFTQETPFSKPDNSHSKTDKSLKLYKVKDDFHLDIVFNAETNKLVEIKQTDFEFSNTFSIFTSQSSYPLIALRGPPTV